MTRAAEIERPACANCGGYQGLEDVAVYERKTGEVRDLSLCTRCRSAPEPAWRLRWSPVPEGVC
jgi:hypothetical protein